MHIGILAAKLTANSGWEHYSRALVLALVDAGHEVTVLVPQNMEIEDDDLDYTIVPILPDVTPQEPRFLFKLADALPSARMMLMDCDVIHTTVELYAPLAAMIAGSRPLVMTVHGSYARYPQQRGWPVSMLYKWAYRRTVMACVSHYTEQVAKQVLPAARTHVIANAVDAERFAHLPTPSQPKRGPTVITAGGVKRRKGTLELVRAIAKVRETIPEVQCLVLGTTSAEPNYVDQVEGDIERLGLEDTVHLLGFVPEKTLLESYAVADVFVLPSMNDGWKFEGFGLVHLEASAAGLPVIGTDNSGVVEAIDDGVTGLIVSQTDVEQELPPAIVRLLTDESLARKMGEAGRRKAQAATWTHVAQQMVALYQSLLR
ncbi:MAG: glycosyltransferase family 4 protein [Anaerolineae bacterium]|nr:glycosyltransferase family 4 protein [Anaerolineae bacterium]